MTKLEQAARQALGALEVAITPLEEDRQEVLRAITALREALSGVQEPALFVSAKQLADLVDPSHATGGSYLPARKTRAGLFTQPLYTAPQPSPAAVAHDEDLLEKLYWEFDSQRKKTGEERLAFKGKMRSYASEFRRRSDGKMAFSQSVSDDMMNLADRLGSEYDDVDPRAWKHLLVYAPKAAPAPLSVQDEEVAMYRWLRAQHEDDSGELRCCVYAPNDMLECLVPVGDMPGELDAFIRAALAAQGGK